MKSFFIKMHLRNQILVVMLFIVVISLLLSIATPFYWSNKIVVDLIHNNTKITLEEKVQTLSFIFEDAVNISRLILSNSEIQTIIKSSTDEYKYADRQKMQEILGLASVFKNYIETITVISYQGPIFEYKSGFTASQQTNRFEDIEEYATAIQKSGMYQWAFLSNGRGSQKVITLMRVINDINTITPIGMIVIQFDMDYLNEILKETAINLDQHTILFDRQSQTIISSSSAMDSLPDLEPSILSGNRKGTVIQAGQSEYYFVSEDILPDQLLFASMINLDEIYKTIRVMSQMFIIVIVVSFLVAFLLANRLSLFLAKPLYHLEHSMSHVQNGNFEISASIKGNREIDSLVHSFKTMLDRIDRYIEENYNEKIMRKDSELNLLQAQINPHFLYNALDAINWMALANEQEEIHRMALALSKIMRISLNYGKKFTTIADEIEHVKNYLTIMEQRYTWILSVRYEIPEDLLPCKTVKTVLQPLVENSILHGFKDIQDEAILMISAKRLAEDILITVVDNGQGGDAAKINQLLKEAGDEIPSFGLKNVNARIKLAFGDSYGLSFASHEPRGIAATIRIPFQLCTDECKEISV